MWQATRNEAESAGGVVGMRRHNIAQFDVQGKEARDERWGKR